jgi:TAT (twin-arginine translocation) pathway signal sequence
MGGTPTRALISSIPTACRSSRLAILTGQMRPRPELSLNRGTAGVRGMVAAVAPRARLAVRPERGEYSRKFGVHLGNADFDGSSKLMKEVTMQRRDFLKGAASLIAAAGSGPVSAQELSNPRILEFLKIHWCYGRPKLRPSNHPGIPAGRLGDERSARI